MKLPSVYVNTLRPRQNGRHYADDTFKRIFVNENVRISIEFSLKFVPKGPINNIPALVQMMAWCRPGDKPLSEPMLVRSLTHICVTRPQWVNICGEKRTVAVNYFHVQIYSCLLTINVAQPMEKWARIIINKYVWRYVMLDVRCGSGLNWLSMNHIANTHWVIFA